MNEARLLLCTDMDRTLIPNGAEREHPSAHSCFAAFCRLPQVTLVYVTGRHEAPVREAMMEYDLPVPDFAITDVGTKIYRINEKEPDKDWLEVQEWVDEIDEEWNGRSHAQLSALFDDLGELRLQEPAKQNSHKLSYYVALDVDSGRLLQLMEERLHACGVRASLVWSVDEPRGVGLLDLLPLNATKVHAIDFLRGRLAYSPAEVVFAGDSGNDLPVLASHVQSVLVANASKEVREEAMRLAEGKGNLQSLYLATGKYNGMDGNYSAGILEGVYHFVPTLRDKLKESGFSNEE